MEAGNYAGSEIARALAGSGCKLVPDIIAGGGAGDANGSLVNILLAKMIRDGLHEPAARAAAPATA